MKKRLFASFMVLAMAVGCLAGCGGNTSTPAATDGDSSGDSAASVTYEWKMHLNSTPGDGAYDTGAAFAERIEEITNGQVKVTLYGGAALGTTTEVLEGMSYGVADCMVESVGTLAPFSQMANIDAMPYIYSDYDHFMAVWSGDLGAEMKQAIGDDANFKLLGAGFRGPRVVTATRELQSVADFSGFKLRAPNLEMYIKTWQWMGSAPTPLAMGETYTAMQQGTVEGQENPMIDSISYSFQEVCKYWIKTNHVYSCNVIVFDKTMFDALPADIQAACEEAANWATEKMSQTIAANISVAEQRLIEEFDCTVIEVDTQAFIDHFDGFAEANFPYLADWTQRILDVN